MLQHTILPLAPVTYLPARTFSALWFLWQFSSPAKVQNVSLQQSFLVPKYKFLAVLMGSHGCTHGPHTHARCFLAICIVFGVGSGGGGGGGVAGKVTERSWGDRARVGATRSYATKLLVYRGR